MSSKSLEPRVLFARLKLDTGQLLQVLVAHFHHEGQAREQMWRDLPLLSWDARIPLLTLCDSNSVLVAGHDSAKTSARDSGRCVVDAREREVLYLSQLGLSDSWNMAHPPEETPDDLRPQGWTWGPPAPVAESSHEARIKRKIGHRVLTECTFLLVLLRRSLVCTLDLLVVPATKQLFCSSISLLNPGATDGSVPPNSCSTQLHVLRCILT